MKIKKILSIALGAVMSISLIACGDDDNTATGTDASKDFVEKVTFVGKLEPAEDLAVLSCDEMTIMIEKLNVEATQAVTINYSGKVKNSKDGSETDVNESYVFNVSKSGLNTYNFVSGESDLRETFGRINNDEFTFYVRLVSSGKVKNTAKAYKYKFIGNKQ